MRNTVQNKMRIHLKSNLNLNRKLHDRANTTINCVVKKSELNLDKKCKKTNNNFRAGQE